MLFQDFEPAFGRVPTEVEVEYMRFIEPCAVVGAGSSVSLAPIAKAYLEVQDAHLDVQIPDAQITKRWGFTPKEGETYTLRDFTLMVTEVEGPRCFVLLSAKDGPNTPNRRTYTTAQDLKDWNDDVLPFGYSIDDFLTEEEYLAEVGA